jgi:SAM-dependent methyltransferase
MAHLWNSPLYKLTTPDRRSIVVDVTSSVSAGLPPNEILRESVIPLFRAGRVQRVVDFGAGSLRHAFPLLKAGFQVCAVEFEEQFVRETCAKARKRAERNHNFSTLIWPKDFKDDNRKFDAALLCYVLQTMPCPEERKVALKLLFKKLKDDSYLLWMSRYGQLQNVPSCQKVSDGYYQRPERDHKSFVREFTTEETHEMMESFGFRRLRSLGKRGTDQIFLYGKGSATWI